MQPVSLTLLWHQHQPYYPDDVSGETLMPWVRLHGTKDYIGMALHIAEVPEFRCSINLVPSLLAQIQRYVEGGSDRHLDVAKLPADSLTEEDSLYLLETFFMANEQSMIRPFPRYRELYLKRGQGHDSARSALPRFSTQDFLDLQIWNNLTWFHELLFERDPELAEFRERGKGWSEEDKTWLLDRQREILAEIVPLHRKLMEGGQVEITTTPFYHPILPLLWDKKSAREAMPGCLLPKHIEPYVEDAVAQIQRAVDYHTELFGAPPRGMWPSEGSVSQQIIEAIAAAGIEWIATDEEILSHSTDGFVHRDGQGHINRPEMLFRPWRVEGDGKSLQIIFRDHGLSDLIGFQYQRNDPQWAADDLLAKISAIGNSVRSHNPEQHPLVPIILDGENCWEYYSDGGVEFLRHLYRTAVRSKDVHPMRVSDHLEKYPATHKIGRLFAGSWISHDFYIWIGHQEDRDAWDLLHITREFLVRATESNRFDKDVLERAWNELYIAEGSDWFWWFGDDHNSAQDELFDELFRRHLRNVYQILDEMPPSSLQRPVARVERRQLHSQPRAFLNVNVDGQFSFFEWHNAGHYEAGSERGTMTMVTEGLLKHIYFGFDSDRLLIRLDAERRADSEFAGLDEIRIRFGTPYGYELGIEPAKSGSPKCELRKDGVAIESATIECALARILEVAIPWESLEAKIDSPIEFAVELFQDGQSIDRAPSEGTIEARVPPTDFETRMWQA